MENLKNNGRGSADSFYPVTTRFQSPFPVPTFPDISMFEIPRLDLAAVENWYVWFKERLTLHRDQGIALFDANNVIPFPAMTPFERLKDLEAGTADLRGLHEEICHQVRYAAYQANQGAARKNEARQALDAAMDRIDSLRERLSAGRSRKPTGLSAAGLKTSVDQYVRAHRDWVKQFQGYMNQLLDRGVTSWEQIAFAGDFTHCKLGKEIYRKDGELWLNRRLPVVQALESLHKDFHGMMAVEAEIASALRSRGLNTDEQNHVRSLVLSRVNKVMRVSDALVDSIGPAFLAVYGEGTTIAAPALPNVLKPIQLSLVLADMADWEKRIIGIIETRHDPGIDSILLHTGCPTGQRIAAAMTDPVLGTSFRVPLERIDSAHMRYHTSGAKIVAFVQEGLIDDALAAVPTLQNEGRKLAAFLNSVGQAINISG